MLHAPGPARVCNRCLVNKTTALLGAFTSIISVGVKLNNLERILVKHEMSVD